MTGRATPLRVIFRCDASDTIGGGHTMRCLALANELAREGAKVVFVAATMPDAMAQRIVSAGHQIARIPASPELQREGPRWEEPGLSAEAQTADAKATGEAAGRSDWVVVDHYLLDARWHSAARAFAGQVLVIDDLANRACDCDMLLDQTLGRSAEDYRALVPSGARILTGPTYALLRPEFARERPAALKRRQIAGAVRRILISMGTADAGGITARVLKHVLAAAPGCAVDVVVGPQAASLEQLRNLPSDRSQVSVHVNSERMAELIREADIAAGAAGVTSWERCCLGLPSIMLVLAENQRASARALAASGASLVADHVDEIGSKLRSLIDDIEAAARMSAASFAITDGLGTGRVLDVMLSGESSGEILLRPVTLADGERLWLWRNDPPTRAQSRTSDPISWSDHINWLRVALDRPGGHFFLAERNGMPVGNVRFDPLEAGGHEVSIAVAPEGRGTGCGAAMLRAACAQMGNGTIYAWVREDNVPSRRLFESCGFIAIDSAATGFLRYLLVTNDSEHRRNMA